MLISEKLARFCREHQIACVTDEPMQNYTSFEIGGRAELIAKPATTEQLKEVLRFCHERGAEPLIIGNGSDLLVTDKGISRPVVQLGRSYGDMRVENGDQIVCYAGASLARVCLFAQQNALSGLEFAYGIPGSVGGAVYMNAGAYDGEMRDVVCCVTHVTPEGEMRTACGEACDFGYRHSAYNYNGCCIAEVRLQLRAGAREEILTKMEDLLARRRSKQPLEYPSAGSTFKRPVGGYASALIDECGLKGRRVGGAMVSEKHAGFLINYDCATCHDVLELVRAVQDEVFAKTGFKLECEIKYIEG